MWLERIQTLPAFLTGQSAKLTTSSLWSMAPAAKINLINSPRPFKGKYLKWTFGLILSSKFETQMECQSRIQSVLYRLSYTVQPNVLDELKLPAIKFVLYSMTRETWTGEIPSFCRSYVQLPLSVTSRTILKTGFTDTHAWVRTVAFNKATLAFNTKFIAESFSADAFKQRRRPLCDPKISISVSENKRNLCKEVQCDF